MEHIIILIDHGRVDEPPWTHEPISLGMVTASDAFIRTWCVSRAPASVNGGLQQTSVPSRLEISICLFQGKHTLKPTSFVERYACATIIVIGLTL